MQLPHPHPDPKTDSVEYRNIRMYGELLVIALFIMYAAAFFAYTWLERQELRYQLSTFAQDIEHRGGVPASTENAMPSYPPDTIVLARGQNTQHREGYYETKISGRDYMVYSDPHSDVIVGRSEDPLNEESRKLLAVLTALYIGNLLILFGWWAYMKGQIAQVFKTQ